MNGRIVHCVAESKHFLTVESNEGGVIRSVFANLDGTPMVDNGLKYAGDHPNLVEVYLDSISGNHFAKVKASLLPALEKGSVDVYQGVGGVAGWFVEAPDFTLEGRHGGGADEDAPGAIAVDETPAAPQVNPMGVARRPKLGRPAKKTRTKKAA